jgi:hypothetical protein
MRPTGPIVRRVREAIAEEASCSPRQIIHAESVDSRTEFISRYRFFDAVDAMIEVVTTILLSLSISLFAAHAYDAYRTR